MKRKEEEKKKGGKKRHKCSSGVDPFEIQMKSHGTFTSLFGNNDSPKDSDNLKNSNKNIVETEG